ncbi:cys Met metabolism pyridoxal-phosphate-dependent protein, putative [Babesia caballi]|uniref:Cys Met metabolism pyridoxal-phosphate-dependent protein, putative n=1 Tax=Babesia caballi TaxID=5871 RepID=A0AAV4LZI9_BABCB|nr:cys Met metabolism pyridoxal-phosphate-dependent protein, putative [Babesia caballi]
MVKEKSSSLFKEPVAAVVEHLPDGLTCRAGLLRPQLARRLVREFNDDGATSVFDAAPEAVLVDVPFRKLIHESRVVQRLYYGMEDSDAPLYAKERAAQNDLMLLDPVRLASRCNERLESGKRQLLMRCFSPDVWLGFFKMVSLGIGERTRHVYAVSHGPVADDEFLNCLEELQLGLVSVASKITNCNASGYTLEDIETLIVDGCSGLLAAAQHIQDNWGSVADCGSTISDLVLFLSHNIAKVNNLLYSEIAVDGHGSEDGVTVLEVKEGIDIAQLRETCMAIIAFVSTAASALSVLKIKILDKRDALLQKPGAFGNLSAEVFKRGILTSEYKPEEVVQMLILAHCLEAYGIREWCVRFVVEKQTPTLCTLLHNLNLVGDVQLLKLEPSAFFRTAGAVAPAMKDFVLLFPRELVSYICTLYNAEH